MFSRSVAMCFGVAEQTWTCSCLFFGASATGPSRDFNGLLRTSLLFMGGKGDSTKRSSDCVGLEFRPSHCKQSFIRGLTFELSGEHRQDALAAQRIIGYVAARPVWPAGGRPLERRVRPC